MSAVRCLPSGIKTYGLRYRDRTTGKRRWDALGLHGSITPDQARTLARKRAGEVADNRDPLAERRAQRLAAKRADGLAFRAIAERFIERHAKKENRRWAETDRILRRYVLPAWGDRQIAAINRQDVTELLDLIEDAKLRDSENAQRKLGGPVMADRTLAAIQKLFNWHAVRDESFRSPIVKGMSRTKPKERARERILNDEEIRALWKACDGEVVDGRAVRFMLLSAQRPGEVLALRRCDIDDGVWTLAVQRRTRRSARITPLSASAQEIVSTILPHPGRRFPVHHPRKLAVLR